MIKVLLSKWSHKLFATVSILTLMLSLSVKIAIADDSQKTKFWETLRAQAENGDLVSQWAFCGGYVNGDIPREIALKWCTVAAERGNSNAALILVAVVIDSVRVL